LSDVDIVVKHVCTEAQVLKFKMAELEETEIELESLRSDLRSLEVEQDENVGAIELLTSRLEVEAVLIEELRVKLPVDGGGVRKKRLQSEIDSAEKKRLEHEIELRGVKLDEATLWKEIELRRGEESTLEERIKDLIKARDGIIENLINLRMYEVEPVAM